MSIKKCQIHAISPITCFTVPIVGITELNLTEDEIYKCLCSKAEVKEILENGKMINLDFTNYNRNNSIIGEPTVTNEVPKHVEEEPVKIEEPVEEVTTEVEEQHHPLIEEIHNEEAVEETVETIQEEVAEENTSEEKNNYNRNRNNNRKNRKK